jgi:hypothetical protein
MARLPGGQHQYHYGIGFSSWWQQHIVSIKDSPYAGMDFHHEPEMPLPPGKAWGPTSKCFLILSYFHFWGEMHTDTHWLVYAYVGPECQEGWG